MDFLVVEGYIVFCVVDLVDEVFVICIVVVDMMGNVMGMVVYKIIMNFEIYVKVKKEL